MTQHIDLGAVLAQPPRFVVGDALAGTDTVQDHRLLGLPVRWNEQTNRLAHHLVSRVAEQALSTALHLHLGNTIAETVRQRSLQTESH